MDAQVAQTEIFWTAFHNLPKAQQRTIMERLLEDPEVREDLIDIAYFEQRRDEPQRPLREYLSERSK